ncbi:hypothetical protein [Candidatus Palauibacter sp.]|uniref:hypothetical protein n=1 Tax=Candidatus Palauibacter sp. TaxID=3101350 RepID=UPI003B01960B
MATKPRNVIPTLAALASTLVALPVSAQDVRPIPLPDLLVTGQSICPTSPEELRRAFELYEAVLPALTSAASTADLRDLQVRMMRPGVLLSRGGRRFNADSMTVVVPTSPVAASPPHVETYGYAEVDRDAETTFYTPDGDALASPGFLATHCLNILETEDAARVGLAFEPKPDRTVVDVRGVLWIDADSSTPRELVFHYTSLRRFLRQNLEAALLEDVRSRVPRWARDVVSFYRLAVDETRFGGVLHFERPVPERQGTGAWASP